MKKIVLLIVLALLLCVSAVREPRAHGYGESPCLIPLIPFVACAQLLDR